SVQDLQIALKQHLQVGVLLPTDKGGPPAGENGAADTGFLQSHALPVPVVRGMMLIRCNSLLRGHSGVRIELIQAILTLLEKNMTPVVPRRGSISASGDLCPLSYIAGMLEGNPDVYVRIDEPGQKNPAYLSADKALETAGITPLPLQAKEGLGITNGTATSCAAACIAIHNASQLALLVHLLTATGTEALLGRAGNYHPFISSVRPHPGQAESAHTILSFLAGSTLSPGGPAPEKATELAQDRYALRTAPQWLGPYLEDLALAHRQITTELNSTTDNPLINPETGQMFHGGNFQAMSLTAALEKTLLGLQAMGKLLQTQSAELLNYALTKGGLPPNLSADDPSLSFTCKGLDVNMAAYMAELSYLAHPVSSHVQNAEMDNQMVNSLALVAGRYVLEAGEAVDLRCLHVEFELRTRREVEAVAREVFGPITGQDGEGAALWSRMSEAVFGKWTGLAHLDLADRARAAAVEATGAVVQILLSSGDGCSGTALDLATLARFQDRTAAVLCTIYEAVRARFFESPTTGRYISSASRMLYEFVRIELAIPMHRGLADHPTFQGQGTNGQKRIIGSYVSEIYLAVRDGRLHGRVAETWKQQACATKAQDRRCELC
ncbi:Phenylalanine ammonia-lyase, partial [Aspergillus sp. HF37]